MNILISEKFWLNDFCVETETSSKKDFELYLDENPKVLSNLKRLALALEDVERILGQAVIIVKGVRCPDQDRKLLFYRKDSSHFYGQAVDFKCAGISTFKIMEKLTTTYFPFDTLVNEQDCVHLKISDQVGLKLRSRVGKTYLYGNFDFASRTA